MELLLGLQMLLWVTGGIGSYWGLQVITLGYWGLQRVTIAYRGFGDR